MKKILFIVISIVIGISLIPVINASVDTASLGDIELEYTLTSTSTVISHDLTVDELAYIFEYAGNLTDTSDITIAEGSAVEEFDSGLYDDPITYLALTYDTATLTYTVATDLITSDVDLVEGDTVITLYFENVPVTSTAITFLSFVPLIFVAGLLFVMFIKTKTED